MYNVALFLKKYTLKRTVVRGNKDEENGETPTPVDTKVDRDEKKDSTDTPLEKDEKLDEAPAPSTVDPEPKPSNNEKTEHEVTKAA